MTMFSQSRSLRILAAAGLVVAVLQVASAAPSRRNQMAAAAMNNNNNNNNMNNNEEDDVSSESAEFEAPRRGSATRLSGITDDGEGLRADSDLRRMLELDSNGRDTNFANSDEADEGEDADDEQSASNLVDSISTELYREPHTLDTNIENAKVQVSPEDMTSAAGHHHHHHKKHYVSGKLDMGAETGKKGSFKWHDKHPVGGKGRR